MRVFIYQDLVINTDFTPRAEELLQNGAWEMPTEQVKAVFGDKANLADNSNTKFTKTETGYDVVFTAPVTDIAILRDQKKKEAENALTAKIAEITPYYPTDEKVSFAKQEEEALKYKANPNIPLSEIPCIAGISKGRQLALDDLVEKILAKSILFATASGFYMGLKQRIEDLADKAQTEKEMNDINVAEIFAVDVAN